MCLFIMFVVVKARILFLIRLTRTLGRYLAVSMLYIYSMLLAEESDYSVRRKLGYSLSL